jgi:predicted acyltransferase
MTAARDEGIDAFRGLAVLLMVLANYLADVAVVPPWLKHAPDVGLTVIDLIAPLFIFAIGLTYGASLRRRTAVGGAGRAAGHAAGRFLAFMGIGAIISAGEAALAAGPPARGAGWGVLQAIGAAGLVTLPLLFLPPLWRAVCGAALLAAYQLMLDAAWLPMVLGSPHGGLHGSISWAAMLILATAITDHMHGAGREGTGTLRLVLWSGLALAAGALLALLLPGLAPVSKNRVSGSYVLVCLGASGLLFAAFRAALRGPRARVPVLRAWGRNPLLLYILHYLLLALVVLPAVPWWHTGASALLAAGQALGIVVILSVVALLLERRGLIMSL